MYVCMFGGNVPADGQCTHRCNENVITFILHMLPSQFYLTFVWLSDKFMSIMLYNGNDY